VPVWADRRLPLQQFGTADERPGNDIDLDLQADTSLDPVALFHLAAE